MLQQMRNNAKWIWIVIVVAFVGGFLLFQTSGLAGRARRSRPRRPSAKVNGTEITYIAWQNAAAQLVQQQEPQLGRGLTLDERAQLETQAFNDLVNDILLHQEYDKRGIRVTDDEIIDAARTSPPPQFHAVAGAADGRPVRPVEIPALSREPDGSPAGPARRSSRSYYRNEIPKNKLYNEIAGDIFVSGHAAVARVA